MTDSTHTITRSEIRDLEAISAFIENVAEAAVGASQLSEVNDSQSLSSMVLLLKDLCRLNHTKLETVLAKIQKREQP